MPVHVSHVIGSPRPWHIVENATGRVVGTSLTARDAHISAFKRMQAIPGAMPDVKAPRMPEMGALPKVSPKAPKLPTLPKLVLPFLFIFLSLAASAHAGRGFAAFGAPLAGVDPIAVVAPSTPPASSVGPSQLTTDAVGTANIINSTIALVDLNTTDVDTRYLTTGTAQTISGAKTFNGNISSTGAVTATGASSSSFFNVGVTTFTQIICYNGNGHGSTDTNIRRYSVCTQVGTDITMSSTAANAQVWTVNAAGVYQVGVSDTYSVGAFSTGITQNDTSLPTLIYNMTYAQGFRGVDTGGAANQFAHVEASLLCAVNDTIRVHDDGQPNRTDAQAFVMLTRIR